MKVSILMPVFNEASTIGILLKRIQNLPIELEIITVNDASTDQSGIILDKLNLSNIKVIHHPVTHGKGAAVRTALKAASGDIVVIQDADLEYDPEDILKLIVPIKEGNAKVVYGVRSLKSQKLIMKIGNKFLTFVTNKIYGQHLKDMETCYKVMQRDVALALNLECNQFDIEAEITAKLLSAKYYIHEIPISYVARYENKKLSPLDGFPAIISLWKYRKWGKNLEKQNAPEIRLIRHRTRTQKGSGRFAPSMLLRRLAWRWIGQSFR